MPDIRPFAGLSQEETTQAMLYFLALIADKLPRLDAQDRMVITHAESGVSVNGSLTTVGTVTNMTQMGGFPINNVPFNLSSAGATTIYDNIKVT